MTDIAALLDAVIIEALTFRASDIHIQPYPDSYRIRFRIDGLLYDKHHYELRQAIQLIARIKVLSQLDVAEKRRPQDGNFRLNIDTFESDCRVATFPSLYGEKVVIRLFDRADQCRTLEAIGCTQPIYERIVHHMRSESGFFLITGPTGSGKTTTAHALLSAISPDKNIVTLEDPIEYLIPGVTQSQIQPELGLTFEAGLRALLRQDPDVLLVGEIRDTETAQVAVQAALTGHQVVSTMHTNDAPGALIRLIYMGSERYLLAAALKIIIAQRLVRRLCTSCRYEIIPSKEQSILLEKFGRPLARLYQARGCEGCYRSGFKGRIGIFQLFEMSASLRSLFCEGASYDRMSYEAYQEGMCSLASDALDRVEQGEIAFDEWIKLVII